MLVLLRQSVVLGAGTWLAAMRNRLLFVSVAFAVVLIGLSLAAASVSIGEHARLIIDVGLAAASIVGSVMAIALAVSSLAGELRSRTAYIVLVRPIPRAAFVFGKFLGLWVAMCMVTTLMLAATALVVSVYGDVVPPVFWGCFLLSYVEMAIVLAVALLFAGLATPVLAATYSVGVIIAGNFAADVWAFGQSEAAASLRPFVEFFYYLLPDLQDLSLRSEAANALPLPTDVLLGGILYGALYAFTALMLAGISFARQRQL